MPPIPAFAITVSNGRESAVGGFSTILAAAHPHGRGVLHSLRGLSAKASLSPRPQPEDRYPPLVHSSAGFVHMAIHRPAEVACFLLGSAHLTAVKAVKGSKKQ